MTCDDIRVRFDEYVDGGLAPAEREAVDRHLDGCNECRGEMARLQALLAAARSLPRRIEPSRDLWSGIAARLTPADRRPPALRPGETGEPAESRGRRPVGGPARRWMLAAAAVLLVALSAGATALWLGRLPVERFSQERARYARATAALAERLAGDAGGLPPTTLAVVRRNLEIVDAAIREAEAALATDPGNPELEQMLVARYEQRLALLARATRLARGAS
ncbi:MAG TPA: zf-HC2 domain-containing protein [Gemmatimonadales bacterium]|nr:zf-HC2 domain-containing protein [Gemmatimonadales bacterium]